MSNPAACSVCGERDHASRHCPCLTKELEVGFYKPSGGMPRGGDEDDESLNRATFTPLTTVFIKNNACRYRNIQRPQNPILANGYDGRGERLNE